MGPLKVKDVPCPALGNSPEIIAQMQILSTLFKYMIFQVKSRISLSLSQMPQPQHIDDAGKPKKSESPDH
jgi:hypothetical protein